MMRQILSSIVLTILFQACLKKEVRQEQIVGRYVKEVSFEVIHPFTNRNLGMGKIRDTIFVFPKQNGYEIVNNKWRKNDYDTLGWQNLQLEDNQPMPTYREHSIPPTARLTLKCPVYFYL